MSERKNYATLSQKQKIRRLNEAYENSLQDLLLNRERNNVFSNEANICPRDVPMSGRSETDNNCVNLNVEEMQPSFEILDVELSHSLNYENNVTDTLSNDSFSESDISDSFGSFNELESNINSNSSNNINSNNINEAFDLKEFLRDWSVTFNIRDRALTRLLHGLNKFGLHELPLDARTLKGTPKRNTFSSMGTGSYAHYGLQNGLLDQFKTLDQSKIPKDIALILNIDGLPISKSSSSQVWPVLMKIANYSGGPCDPFAVGIFHGDGKPPNVNEFLEPTISEYIQLSDVGFEYNNKVYKVFLKLFNADTVARNYVMCFPPHNSRCGKCEQIGKTIEHRRVFLENDSNLRTDENFRKDVPLQYQNLLSPLEGIISLTKQVPLDPMHLLDEGVGKKHIKLLLNFYGKFGADAKRRLQILNNEYIAFKGWVPSDFVRKTRTLDYIDRFKATELRLANLYLMPILFQNKIPDELMLHFNLLNCALRILYDSNECIRNNPLAKELLTVYVNQMKQYFGEIQIIFNVHNLLHLADDVLRFGPLDYFSAISFENFLQTIKQLVRKGSYPLAQIMNRLNEKSQIAITQRKHSIPQGHFILKNDINVQLPNNYSKPHRKIQFCNFFLSDKKPDNCCYLKDGSVVVIKHICYLNDLPIILTFKYENLTSIDNYPIDSTLLDIYKTNKLSANLQAWPISSIKKKGFRVFSNGFYYIFPLLHSKN